MHIIINIYESSAIFLKFQRQFQCHYEYLRNHYCVKNRLVKWKIHITKQQNITLFNIKETKLDSVNE